MVGGGSVKIFSRYEFIYESTTLEDKCPDLVLAELGLVVGLLGIIFNG